MPLKSTGTLALPHLPLRFRCKVHDKNGLLAFAFMMNVYFVEGQLTICKMHHCILCLLMHLKSVFSNAKCIVVIYKFWEI